VKVNQFTLTKFWPAPVTTSGTPCARQTSRSWLADTVRQLCQPPVLPIPKLRIAGLLRLLRCTSTNPRTLEPVPEATRALNCLNGAEPKIDVVVLEPVALADPVEHSGRHPVRGCLGNSNLDQIVVNQADCRRFRALLAESGQQPPGRGTQAVGGTAQRCTASPVSQSDPADRHALLALTALGMRPHHRTRTRLHARTPIRLRTDVADVEAAVHV
jgi:hypothetical protein